MLPAGPTAGTRTADSAGRTAARSRRVLVGMRRVLVGMWTLRPAVCETATQPDRHGRDCLGSAQDEVDRLDDPAPAPAIRVVFGIRLIESVQPRIRPAHDGPSHRPDASGRPAAGRGRPTQHVGQRHTGSHPISASHRDRRRRHGIVDG